MRTTFATLLATTLLMAGACNRAEPTASQPASADSAAPPPAATPEAQGVDSAPPDAPAPPAGSAPRETTPPSRAAAAGAGAGLEPATPAPARRYREITLPAGTALPLKLDTALASDTSHVEDAVRASVRRAVIVDGLTVVPAGADVSGAVTGVERSGKVKGVARLAFRFTSLVLDGEQYDIRTGAVTRQAATTKKKDATKIGIGAGAGAIIGGIIGGGKGAAVGTAVGGGAGTGMVLGTRGQEVRLASGTPVTVTLTAPLQVRVPVDGDRAR